MFCPDRKERDGLADWDEWRVLWRRFFPALTDADWIKCPPGFIEGPL